MRVNSLFKKLLAAVCALALTTTLCACDITDAVLDKVDELTTPSVSEDTEEEITEWVEDPPEISMSADGYVLFGKYEQDGNIANGPEPIEWEVLETNSTGVLLITRYVLDAIQYDTDMNVTNWGSSNLRMWLNTDFYQDCFCNGDRLFMVPVTTTNGNNLFFGTEGGDDTEEKIFILDLEQLKKYYSMDLWYDDFQFGLSKKLIVQATPSAIANGVYSDTLTDNYFNENADYKRFANDNLFKREELNGFISSNAGMTGAQWWVRTIGSNVSTVCFVSQYGRLGYYYVTAISKKDVGVRPCVYIKSLPEQ